MVSLDPMGMGLRGAPPDGALDYISESRIFGDDFFPLQDVPGSTPALGGLTGRRIPWGRGHHDAFAARHGHLAFVGVMGEDLPEAGVQLELSLLGCDPGLEAAHQHAPPPGAVAEHLAGLGGAVAPGGEAGQVAEGNPELGRLGRIHAEELLGRHADDGKWLAVQGDAMTHDAAVAAELAGPVAVAEDGHVGGAGLEVFFRDGAADGGRDAESAEVVGGDHLAARGGGYAVDVDGDAVAVEVHRDKGKELREPAAAVLEVVQHVVREGGPAEARVAVADGAGQFGVALEAKLDQLLRLGDR